MSEIITVHLDQKPIYDIVIEKDFSQLGTAFSRLNVTGRKICIVTDSNVGPLYSKAVPVSYTHLTLPTTSRV